MHPAAGQPLKKVGSKTEEVQSKTTFKKGWIQNRRNSVKRSRNREKGVQLSHLAFVPSWIL